MKIEKCKIGKVTTTKFTFKDGSVWQEVDLPPEFYRRSKTQQSDASETKSDRSNHE